MNFIPTSWTSMLFLALVVSCYAHPGPAALYVYCKTSGLFWMKSLILLVFSGTMNIFLATVMIAPLTRQNSLFSSWIFHQDIHANKSHGACVVSSQWNGDSGQVDLTKTFDKEGNDRFIGKLTLIDSDLFSSVIMW